MTMKKHLLRYTATLAVGIIIGTYFQASPGVPPEAGAGVKTGEKVSSSPMRGNEKRSRGSDIAAEQQRLKQIVQGTWEPFTGSADELLLSTFIMPGHEETAYFLQRNIAEAPPERLWSWVEDLAKMPPGRTWQPSALQGIIKRLAMMDPARCEGFVRSLSGQMAVNAKSAWLGGMAKLDPDRALEEFANLSTQEKQGAAYAISEAIKGKDPLKAFELLTSDSQSEYQAVSLLGDLATADPHKALELVSKLGGQRSLEGVGRIFNSWAATDTQAALAAAAGLENPAQQRKARENALNSWASRDPKAVISYLQTLPPDAPERLSMGSALGSLAVIDPETVRTLVGALSGNERRNALQNAASQMASKSLADGIRWLDQATTGSDREAILQGLSGKLETGTPEQMEASLAKFPEADRRKVVKYFVQNQAYSNPEMAYQLYQKYPEAVSLENTSLEHYLARKDFKKGVALALDSGREYAFSHAIGHVENLDNADVTAVLMEHSERLTNSEKSQIINRLAASDPTAALTHAQTLTDANSRGETIANVVSQWAAQDMDAALDYASKMSGPERLKTLGRAIGQQGGSDPDAALALARQHGLDTNPAAKAAWNSVSANLVEGYFSQDPAAAVKFVQSLPADQQQNHIGNLASRWAATDPMAASLWIRDLPPGDSRNSAVSNLVSQISSSDPASAYVWIQQLPENQRTSYSDQIFRSWLRRDKTSALAALRDAPLTDDQKKRLLER